MIFYNFLLQSLKQSNKNVDEALAIVRSQQQTIEELKEEISMLKRIVDLTDQLRETEKLVLPQPSEN